MSYHTLSFTLILFLLSQCTFLILCIVGLLLECHALLSPYLVASLFFSVGFASSSLWLPLIIFSAISKGILGSLCTMDSINGGDSRTHIGDEQHSLLGPYVQEHEHHELHHMSNGNGMDDDQNNGDDTNCGGGESVEGEVPSNHGNIPDNHTVMVDQASDGGDQLTLSFQGQVYVFDSVSPDKVHQLI